MGWLVSPFRKFLPLLISGTLVALLFIAAPYIIASQLASQIASQNVPASDKQDNTVQAQMNNVTFHLTQTVAVEIKSLNGVLIPLGKSEFPIFDDKDSFKLRISTAEIAIDSSNLANVLNTYVFARQDSPLKDITVTIGEGALESEGKAP